MKKLIIIFCALIVFGSTALSVSAQNNTIDIQNPITNFQKDSSGSAQNSSDSLGYLKGRLGNLLNLMLRSLAVLSLLPIVFGGIWMITSQGNSEQVEKGKSALFWGFVGLTLSFMAIMLYSLLLRVILPA